MNSSTAKLEVLQLVFLLGHKVLFIDPFSRASEFFVLARLAMGQS
jgi:hypothetical protein